MLRTRVDPVVSNKAKISGNDIPNALLAFAQDFTAKLRRESYINIHLHDKSEAWWQRKMLFRIKNPIHRRDAEDTEITQRKKILRPLCALCVSAVN